MTRHGIRRLLAATLVALPLAFAGCAGDDGSDGTNGGNGLTTLTALTPEPAGDNCANGGQKIESGIDVNGDGALSTGEIDTTQYVCNGAAGDPGIPGTPGTPGADGLNITVAARHGEAFLQSTGEFDSGNTNPKYLVNVEITGATADADGVATVDFTVTDKNDDPVTDLSSMSAGIFKLVPAGNGLSYNQWVPYLYRTETVTATDTPTPPEPAGFKVNQGYRESSSAGTLVNNGDGSYTYTFGLNLTEATLPVGGTAITYDRTLTHRVSVYMGGHSGATGEADYDFVPDGSAVTETRNIVQTASCKKCHGPEFAGHGGDRVTVEGCNTCHSPVTLDAQSGESLEMAVMIHKIHAGNELATVAGPDGQYYDNPWTPANETADNGTYMLWGHGGTGASWEGAAFPAVLANCVACHTGNGEDVDNWKTVPSRAACGSCHDDISFVSPAPVGQTLHSLGAMADDGSCHLCHSASAVAGYHDWTTKDIRNIPEFDVTLTTDTPERGYYIAGESPVLTIVLKDKATGLTIDHTTVIQQQTSSTQPNYDPAEGCIPEPGAEGTACTVERNGKFTAANVYVVGPRAEKVVNLTYAARAVVRSANTGPWNLSAGGSLRVRIDSGMPMLAYNNEEAYEGYGADELISGDITVTLPPTAYSSTYTAGPLLGDLFVDPSAATAAEVADWLNANATFHERAIAYLEERGSLETPAANFGKLAIRSRGVSKKNTDGEVIETTAQRNIQLVTMPVAGMFAANDVNAWKTAGNADSVRIMINASATNPKAVFSTANIQYTLDPVDDLVAGTYIIHVEYADAGRGLNTSSGGINPPEPPYVDYRTPSVAITTFQVKTATEEKPVAGNCTACHWSDAGVGFVLDFPRHNKIFDDKAVDRCGGCHDYLSAEKPDATTQLAYNGSLSKRVHAVHNGANLNYPTITVGHEETSAFGRNWRITYPMEVQDCQSCHPKDTTSGSWTTNPNRLACMGCHDADEATTHINLQTWDPTPLAPWSGDEEESCKACH